MKWSGSILSTPEHARRPGAGARTGQRTWHAYIASGAYTCGEKSRSKACTDRGAGWRSRETRGSREVCCIKCGV